MAEDEYRIVGPGGEEGSCAAYGQAAALAIGANGDTAFYYALVDEVKEGDTVEVYRVDSATAFTAGTDEVEFADEGSGIALVDEEDDEEDDEDEDETV
jgi:hypothetical protein